MIKLTLNKILLYSALVCGVGNLWASDTEFLNDENPVPFTESQIKGCTKKEEVQETASEQAKLLKRIKELKCLTPCTEEELLRSIINVWV